MLKGQVVSGDFSKIVMRVKSNEQVEIGELLAIEDKEELILLQAYDLTYGSQISPQNLEMVSGMSLEEGNYQIMDESLRNYQLAYLKPILNISKNQVSKTCKKLPTFFTKVRSIQKEDLSFITTPPQPLFLGKLRSGSKEMETQLFLPGKEVLSHHVLIPASTGKGKSLAYNEKVLVKINGEVKLVNIGELIDSKMEGNPKVRNTLVPELTSYLDTEGEINAFSLNPTTHICEWKKVTKLIRHNSPLRMHELLTNSGKRVVVTGDHNFLVLRNGALVLLKTTEITSTDFIPQPLSLSLGKKTNYLNLIEIFAEDNQVYVKIPTALANKITEDKLSIIFKNSSRPSQRRREFLKNRKVSVPQLLKLLSINQITSFLKDCKLYGYNERTTFPAKLSLDDNFLRLLGYFIAEGYININAVRISNSDPLIIKDILSITHTLGLTSFRILKNEKTKDIVINSSLLSKLLKHLEVGKNSGDKRFPDFVFNLSSKQLQPLLKGYFEGDGSIYKAGKKNNYEISAVSKSEELSSQLCYLLLSFGITTRKRRVWKRATNSRHKGDFYHNVVISGKDNILAYLNNIGFVTKGKDISQKLNYRSNTNVDLIPISPNLFKKIREKSHLSQKCFGEKCGFSTSMVSALEKGKRKISRDLAFKIIRVLPEMEETKYLKQMLLLHWDKVKSVKPVKYIQKHVYDFSVEKNETFYAGDGGMFVHNSNLMSCILWDLVGKDYAGILVLDPHDEYYGRVGLGLKDHPQHHKVSYYTPHNPPVGANSLKINILQLKPEHFQGAIILSDPQRQMLYIYYKKFKETWIYNILAEKKIEGIAFHEDTIAVVKRKLISLLNLDIENGKLYCQGIFDDIAGEHTLSGICQDLEHGKIVVIDTSYFSGAIEILIGSLIATEVLDKYKYYKRSGLLEEKPVISIVLEEAPRVLGKSVLEQGSNIFDTIAREGRKFKVGLIAITQLPSEIPKTILANMNTKIILGLEMNSERQAVIESSPQDLSQDNRNIAALDKGEALVTSIFTKFAVPVKIPLFKEFAAKSMVENKTKVSFSGVGF
ncbi:MAG: LAGLIDADG family homing endonuclease [Nanoarchaeota archaeon]